MTIFLWIIGAGILTATVGAVALWFRLRNQELIEQSEEIVTIKKRLQILSAVVLVLAAVFGILLWQVVGVRVNERAPSPLPGVGRTSEGGALTLEAMTPSGKIGIANARIRLFFSDELDRQSIDRFSSSVAVTDESGAAIAGEWAMAPAARAAGGWMEFIPSRACRQQPSLRCFPDNAVVTVAMNPTGIKSWRGKILSCPDGCRRSFTLGSRIDTTPPGGEWVQPRAVGGLVNANDQEQALLAVSDTEGVSHGTLQVDGSAVSVAAAQRHDTSVLAIPWNTIGKKIGSTSILVATVYDLNGNTIKIGPVTVTYQEPQQLACTYSWTFATSPGLPFGAACRLNYECASRQCVGGICVEGAPVITAITPSDGIARPHANTYVTIEGRNFGAAQESSKVRF